MEPARPAPRPAPPATRPLVAAGLVLGFGLGGFVDGILLHQILQWHHMASSHPDPAIAQNLSVNTLLDGVFHAATWILVAIGLFMLHRAWRRGDVPPSGRVLTGSLLAGWGLFNLVEGLVNHHLLGIHHVHPSGPGGALVWDLAFLAFGAILAIAGWGLVRSGRDVARGRAASGPRHARGS
ncbi:MAG TPA: DUF2243 domain-containing protein [Candidatus Thermoplasmatota archaeon]|nr:DUF2243 domain-containing protein [Candidatus Thermoplasmatota archaeon]